MSKFKKFNLLFLIIILLTSFYYINISKTYAEPTSVSGPSSTFKTNFSGTTINYVKDGLVAASADSGNSSKFLVPKDLKVDGASTPLYVLSRNMSVPGSTEQFEIISGDTPKTVSDPRIVYIISHGYNTINTTNNIFTSNNYGNINNTQKQYVTQIALWLYIYENKSSFSSTYCANSACELSSDARSLINTAASQSGYGYLKYITDLVDAAGSYTGPQTSKFSALNDSSVTYTVNNDNTLLTTNTIQPASKSNNANYMYYSVEISDPNNYGVYLTTPDGEKITNLSLMNGSFKVVVPLKDDIEEMDLRTIMITLHAYYTYDDKEYRVTASSDSLLDASKHQKYSNVVLGTVGNEVVNTGFQLYNIVKISKIDITDSKELPGAKIKITKKDNDEVVEEYTSTDKPHYLYLANGDYKLCETTAPDGYQLNTECIEFKVDGEKMVAVTMKNSPVEIPNTGLFGSNITSLIGAVLLIIGSLFILKITAFNNNNI